MEPEDSLPYSQQSATDPYPEADGSSAYTPSLFIQGRILPSTSRSSEWSLRFKFPGLGWLVGWLVDWSINWV